MSDYASTAPAAAYEVHTPGIEYVSPAPAGNCAAAVNNRGGEDNDESNSDDERKRGDEANNDDL